MAFSKLDNIFSKSKGKGGMGMKDVIRRHRPQKVWTGRFPPLYQLPLLPQQCQNREDTLTQPCVTSFEFEPPTGMPSYRPLGWSSHGCESCGPSIGRERSEQSLYSAGWSTRMRNEWVLVLADLVSEKKKNRRESNTTATTASMDLWTLSTGLVWWTGHWQQRQSKETPSLAAPLCPML